MIRQGLALYLAIVVVGCVKVDPAPDYHRVNEIVSARTAAEDSYDPSTEALIDERVGALLEDGLDLHEAVQVALLNNRGFQAAFLELGVSRADVVQSGLMSNPTLGFSVRFPEGGGRTNLTGALAQQIADLWQIPIRKRIARAQLERTVIDVAHQAVQLVAEVEARYLQVVALQQAAMLLDQDLELAERSSDLARDRFEAGESGRLDANFARAADLDVRRRKILLERDMHLARADLARVLGLTRWDAPWTVSPGFPEDPDIPDEGVLVRWAMSQRLDARAQALRVQAAEARVREQQLLVLPDVTLGVEAERLERRALPGPGDVQRASGTRPRPGERDLERRQIIDSLIGPTLSITLPIWHQNQAQIARARYQVGQRRKEYEDLLDAVAQQVHKAAAAARGAGELTAFIREQMLPLARENLDSAKRAYDAGEQSIVTLMSAQQALITQRAEFVEAQRVRALAHVELRRAVGGRLPPPAPVEDEDQGSMPEASREPPVSALED